MRLGVCWYPEQWDEADWAEDVARMADMGLEVVRLGEFAWARMEPRRDAWDLAWLDRAVDLAHDAGLQVVLGVPTATPPVWLLRERPDIRLVGPDGRVRPYGSRRHTCPTSPAYREESARVAAVLAERYADHPALLAWQVDNEPGNHDSARCWCDACQEAFRAWLADRHGTVEALNAAWGQAFWSMAYPDWSAVDLPAPTMTVHTPSLEVAHRRFASEQVVAGLAVQADVLRARTPATPTFTNLYMGDLDIDAQAVHRLHGLGAIDSYPHGLAGPEEVAFHLDLARGAALAAGEGAEALGGRAWVVEQQPGPINWTGDNPAVAPGQVRGWILQAAEHGIEVLLVFRWRMARAGQEQHHAALLTHDRRDTPAVAEVREAVAALRAAPPRRRRATAAVVVDYGDAWVLQVVPQVDGVTHRALAVAAHTALRAAGHVVDVVPADADLTGYDVVALPALHTVTADRLAAVTGALDAGATVLLGPRSLVRDGEAVWVAEAVPAGLVDRLGARVSHAGSPHGWPRGQVASSAVAVGREAPPGSPPGPAQAGRDGGGAPVLDPGPWVETLEVLAEDAEVLARAVDGPLDGAPVVVRRGDLVHVGAAAPAVWGAVLGLLELEVAPTPPRDQPTAPGT